MLSFFLLSFGYRTLFFFLLSINIAYKKHKYSLKKKTILPIRQISQMNQLITNVKQSLIAKHPDIFSKLTEPATSSNSQLANIP